MSLDVDKLEELLNKLKEELKKLESLRLKLSEEGTRLARELIRAEEIGEKDYLIPRTMELYGLLSIIYPAIVNLATTVQELINTLKEIRENAHLCEDPKYLVVCDKALTLAREAEKTMHDLELELRLMRYEIEDIAKAIASAGYEIPQIKQILESIEQTLQTAHA